ncbi:MAG: hypothetical protein HY898_09920 [Deltaproteobacteria bacterium]|nr:hypothetical protein [Deltaproteobacteria bacterium]
MRPQRILAAIALACTIVLSASNALADLVLLLPARGQIPGSMLSSILDSETRYGVIEVGHKLVDQKELDGAMRQVPDSHPDTSDEFTTMARFARAEWVVIPTVFQQEKSWRLELIAFQAQSGRTETVARDVDTEHIHVQVVEMLKVLLRPQGVGTEALPWETGGITARPASAAPGKTPAAPKETPPAGPHRMFFIGAGFAVNSAVSRPSGATGSATSAAIAARAGISPIEPIDIALNFADNVSGPRAVMLDASLRYMINVAGPKFRIGPEIGPGLFLAQGGSQSKSFMLRATAVAAVNFSPSFGIEAHLGDLRYVPASSGTVVLAGATAMGVLRF